MPKQINSQLELFQRLMSHPYSPLRELGCDQVGAPVYNLSAYSQGFKAAFLDSNSAKRQTLSDSRFATRLTLPDIRPVMAARHGNQSSPALSREQFDKLFAASADEGDEGPISVPRTRNRHGGFIVKRNYDTNVGGGTHRLQIILGTRDAKAITFEIDDTKLNELSIADMSLTVRNRMSRHFVYQNNDRLLKGDDFERLHNSGLFFYKDIIGKEVKELTFVGQGPYAGCRVKLYIGNRDHVHVHKQLVGLVVEGFNDNTKKPWLYHFNEDIEDTTQVDESDSHDIHIGDKTCRLVWPNGQKPTIQDTDLSCQLLTDPLYPNQGAYLQIPGGNILRLYRKERQSVVDLKVFKDIDVLNLSESQIKDGCNVQVSEAYTCHVKIKAGHLMITVDEAIDHEVLPHNGLSLVNFENNECYALQVDHAGFLRVRNITIAEFYGWKLLREDQDDANDGAKEDLDDNAYTSVSKDSALPPEIQDQEAELIETVQLKELHSVRGQRHYAVHINLLAEKNIYILLSPIAFQDEDAGQSLRLPDPEHSYVFIRTVIDGQLVTESRKVYFHNHHSLMFVEGVGIIHLTEALRLVDLDDVAKMFVGVDIYPRTQGLSDDWQPVVSIDDKPLAAARVTKKEDFWSLAGQIVARNWDQLLSGLPVRDFATPLSPKRSENSVGDLHELVKHPGQVQNIQFYGESLFDRYRGRKISRLPVWNVDLPLQITAEGCVVPKTFEKDGKTWVRLGEMNYRSYTYTKKGKSRFRSVHLRGNELVAEYWDDGGSWMLKLEMAKRTIFIKPIQDILDKSDKLSPVISLFITSEEEAVPKAIKAEYPKIVQAWGGRHFTLNFLQAQAISHRDHVEAERVDDHSFKERQNLSVISARELYHNNGTLWPVPGVIRIAYETDWKTEFLTCIVTGQPQTLHLKIDDVMIQFTIHYDLRDGFAFLTDSFKAIIDEEVVDLKFNGAKGKFYHTLQLPNGVEYVLCWYQGFFIIHTQPHAQLEVSELERIDKKINSLSQMKRQQPMIEIDATQNQSLLIPPRIPPGSLWQTLNLTNGCKLSFHMQIGSDEIWRVAAVPYRYPPGYYGQNPGVVNALVQVRLQRPDGEIDEGWLPAVVHEVKFPDGKIQSIHFRDPVWTQGQLMLGFELLQRDGIIRAFSSTVGAHHQELRSSINQLSLDLRKVIKAMSEERITALIRRGIIKLIKT